MNELDLNILKLFDLIYQLREDDKKNILSSIADLSEAEKKGIIVALYERYEEMVGNSNKLIQSLKMINNNIDEYLEENNQNKINVVF